MLSFGAKSCVLQFATQKFKNWDIQSYNIALCFVWELNLVADTEGGT